MCVSPKAGSSSFYRWLYHVSTKGKVFDNCTIFKNNAREHPHKIGPCWRGGTDREHQLNLINPSKLPVEKQLQLLDDPNIFRFAITRNPIDRAISAWKSKLACDGLYNTDLKDREPFLNMLLAASDNWTKAKLKNPHCMTLIEYAYVLRSMSSTDLNALSFAPGGPHFAPQTSTCSFGKVTYDEVQPLETITPTSMSILRLVDRLQTNLEEHPYLHVHASSLNISKPSQGHKESEPHLERIRGTTSDDVILAKQIFAKVFSSDLSLAYVTKK